MLSLIDALVQSRAAPPEPGRGRRRVAAGPVLHQVYVRALLRGARALLSRRQGAVVDLPAPRKGARLIIVGDTHGQLQDVLWLFTLHGPPSRTNVYLFNGDVADRGEQAVEIFALIFGYMLALPGCMHLMRGNHESAAMNERPARSGGGFAAEVRSIS